MHHLVRVHLRHPCQFWRVRLRILIAPDKFKGTLTAREAAEAIARGWRAARTQDELDLLPISDGGDGFGETVGELLHAKVRHTPTIDAAHRKCVAAWWWEPRTKTAIIESAKVIGLAMLPPDTFHPFQLDTFGLGALIRAAAKQGAKRCIIGIGGSATNDGGFGLARALGWKFFDGNAQEIDRWTDLHSAVDIRAPKRRRWFSDLTVAVDVHNPLFGLRGATRIYGPQKGLRAEDFPIAEANLRRLARLAEKTSAVSHARSPGAGAAGGLGFGLMAFAGATVESGFELLAEASRLQERLRAADLVITGEGCLDDSTLMGKGVGELARLARKRRVPCIALAGEIKNRTQIKRAFKEACALSDLTSAANARRQAARWLMSLAEKAATEMAEPQPKA